MPAQARVPSASSDPGQGLEKLPEHLKGDGQQQTSCLGPAGHPWGHPRREPLSPGRPRSGGGVRAWLRPLLWPGSPGQGSQLPGEALVPGHSTTWQAPRGQVPTDLGAGAQALACLGCVALRKSLCLSGHVSPSVN